MSLKFYLGASGSGKSYQLHKDITEQAGKERNRNFLFIVPDQFTMQTQIDLVKASGCGGIMNIDVLSFSRLAHRVFEELGCNNRLVLDDTGKSLVLRRLADRLAESMPVLGANLNKQGYIHEIKSVISEFKQYDISPEKLGELISYSEGKGMLNAKLKDLQIIYREFNNYTRDEFITSEEILTLLCARIGESLIVKDAVVVFDGFTGFTPVQYRLIERLLELTKQVIVSVTIDIDANPYAISGEHELFALSKKTIKNLQETAQSVNVPQDEDVLLKSHPRFKEGKELEHLERNILRYPIKVYKNEVDSLSIYEADRPEEEVNRVCKKIKQLVLEEGYEYRDIAVVCADMESYSDFFLKYSEIYDIPVYIDETRKIRLNPFTEYIRSALNMIKENFSYTSVFHYLRSGISDITADEADRLDNYVYQKGIKGISKYRNAFTALPYPVTRGGEIRDYNIEELNRLNDIRKRLLDSVEPLIRKSGTVSEFTEGLYEFIVKNDCQRKLAEYEKFFTERGMNDKASEYAQIYRVIIDLLDSMHALLKDEKIKLDEFIKILDSGIEEIDVGTIPGGIDRIMVGDIERSRIANVKVMFFTGVNDGNIPKANSKGGLISDIDREFLKGSNIELSPTPREQVFIQRLYLYMNMTKPSEKLLISYSRVSNEQKALKPSYLVENVKKMFPEIPHLKTDDIKSEFNNIYGNKDGMAHFSVALREYSEGNLHSMSEEELLVVLKTLLNTKENRRRIEELIDTAFFEYKAKPLSKELAKKLYGEILRNSVSRLERFAQCEYAHFLQYAMNLKEREEYEVNYADLGNIYHAVLESFAVIIGERGYTMADYPEEMADGVLAEVLRNLSINYADALFASTYANEHMIEKIRKIMKKTLSVIRYQLGDGSFKPVYFEKKFKKCIDYENGSMEITGRIDRIDLFRDGDRMYVKVIDYKSSERDIELDSLYYGLQLQQPLYMLAALDRVANDFTDVLPYMAAMLYSKPDDPILETNEEVTPEEIEEKIDIMMRPKGLIINDDAAVMGMDPKLGMDGYTSRVIPVAKKKNGEYTAKSALVSQEEYRIIEKYTEKKLKDMGTGIMEGRMEIAPTVYKDMNACTYCAYRDICSFDEKQAGFKSRNYASISKEEAVKLMSEAVEKTEE